ncbi:MAG: hypothetical protein ACYC5O_22660 [Anaerolineae bacterium]
MPEAVQQLAADTGAAVDSRRYVAWESASAGLPEHVRAKLAAVRAGDEAGSGCFVNGRCLPLSPHNAAEAVALRRALLEAAGSAEEDGSPAWSARGLDTASITASTAATLRLDDNAITELGAFCNQIERVWFFDGSIGSMSLDCRVGSLHYRG